MPAPYLGSPMTLSQFNALPYEQQLALVYAEGGYVATRWHEVYESMLLYQLPGRFFVELTYDTETNEVQYLFAFEAGGEEDRLPDYAAFVKPPDWLPETE
jgi:hypothetical protein